MPGVRLRLRRRAIIETIGDIRIGRAPQREYQMQISRQLRFACAVITALLIGSSAPALAADAVSVGQPWVRATVPGQSVAGAYMDITAKTNAALVGVASPVAAKAELHTMAMDGSVMKMRPLDKLDLPAGKTVNLKPGGYHVMLVDIKRELKAGERVPLTLTVQDAHGARSTLQVDAEVRPAVASGHAH
jgi:periplasmic copper chaperone A